MKKITSLLIVFLMCISFNVSAQDVISVNLDGRNLKFEDQQPEIIDGRTLVPMRVIFEALGGEVTWDGEKQTAICERLLSVIKITIEQKYMLVNGSKRNLDVPAKLINSRTMVPARAVAEAFGCNVDWDNENRTVIIETDDYIEKTREFEKYTSSENYTISYPDDKGYTIEKGKSASKDGYDFSILSRGENFNSSLLIAVSNNPDGLDSALDSNLENSIKESLLKEDSNIIFGSFEKTVYDGYVLVEYTYYKEGEYNAIHKSYCTDTSIYTIAEMISSEASKEVKADFDFIYTSFRLGE